MNTVFSQYGDPNDTSDPTVTRPKQRRKRDVLACAECRRLKLKCDKTWPCKTCVRRGCSAICPMGSMAPGKAGRMIVANTETLHARIATLCTRIRDLEDALESVAGPAHPQLADALRQLKAPLSADGSAPQGDSSQNGHGDSQDASCCKGSSNETSPQPMEELLQLGRHFPQPIDEEDLIDAAKTIQDIKGMLPTWDRGGELVASFYMGFGSTFLMIPQAAFERIRKEAYELAPGRTDIDGVHKLALVYLTFAMACFHNSQMGDEESEAESYYQLAQSLYCIRSVIESTNDATVLGLTILAVYVRTTNRATSSWTLLGIVTKLVLGNNLHRDPTRFGFTGDDAALKRTLFWELYSYDILYSFITLRPPMYNMAFIDCPYPEVDLNSPDKATRVAANYLWKWRYTAEVMPKLMEEVFGCKTPTYAKVLEMDKMIRTSWLPECLQADRQNPATLQDGIRSAAIQRFTVFWFKELALMYLHRNLLAIALTEGRADPLQHKYSPSILAAFRSAFKLSTSLRALIAEPGTAGQHICFFAHGFAAVTVLGSIAVLAPQTPFGQLAGTEVLAIMEIYDASTMPMPSKIRPWLKLLKERIQQERAGVILPPLPLAPLCAPDWEEFGDVDRLISTRALKTHVRKDKEGTPTTTFVCAAESAPEPVPPNSGTLYPDFFALNLADPQSNTAFMNEPIAVSFFPPTVGDITFDPLPLQQAPLPLETLAIPTLQPALGLNVQGYNAPPQATSDVEINVQWERFLSSIGLNMDTSAS